MASLGIDTSKFPLEPNAFETSADVAEVQQRLRALGYRDMEGKELKIDGVFGARTESAVRAFQRNTGIAESGMVTLATWNAIGKAAPASTGGSGLIDGGGEYARIQEEQARRDAERQKTIQTSASAFEALKALPKWQLGLMVAGGVALVGGLFYLLTQEKKAKAASVGTFDHFFSGTDEPSASTRPTHCQRLPPPEAFETGTLLEE